MTERCLIILAKEPQPGLVKTRLAATLGAEPATELYRCFLADTLNLARNVVPDERLLFAFWPPEAAGYFQKLAPSARCMPQSGVSFGERLASAFRAAAATGATRLVLIGTDSPSLPAGYVEEAFALLDSPSIDVVLGPCADGGWYLMGLRRPESRLFTGIAWSTSVVYAQTLARAAEAGLRVAALPPWYDIDTAADLPRLYHDLRRRSNGHEPSQTLVALERLMASGALDAAAELAAP